MSEGKLSMSKIVITSILEPKDELDEKLEKSYSTLLSITKDLSEREANDALQAFVSRGSPQHDDIQFGFFYAILTDPKMSAKNYRDMTLVNQDGLSKVITVSNQLIYEKWIRFTDTCRTQTLVSDRCCPDIVRCWYIQGGDLSPKNVWLTETLLDILTENRSWVDKCPQLLPVVLYTYLRIIIDHGSTSLAILRQREVDFCIALIRERWLDCQTIGRDLIRLLQGVARIPEFEELWKDIINNPTSISPSFTGIKQLLQTKTSRRFFLSRLTPDMENKLVFLTSRVRFGQQKRYQDWFQRQYLSTPESQSLRCDLIRYICAVIHPSNEVLCSDIIPRWAVIGWLLTTCTSNVAASNAKLALFFDWLFFDAEKDNIMNIEPCILVMHHSMRPHPAITATLLDFMCRIMSNFYPPLTPLVKQGIFASLHTILDKRVLPSLSPLFDNSKLDKELRTTLKDNFSEFCTTGEGLRDDGGGLNVAKDAADDLMMMMMMTGGNNVITSNNNNSHISSTTTANTSSMGGLLSSPDVAEFSDDDEIPLVKLKNEKKVSLSAVRQSIKKEVQIKEIRKYRHVDDITKYLNSLDDTLKTYVTQLQHETDKEAACEVMDRLTQEIIHSDFDSEDAESLAICLCQILVGHFDSKIFPLELDDELIEDSIGVPLFVIFRNLCQTPEDDPSRQPLLSLLEEMYKRQPRVGYHLLYFLKVGKVQHDERMTSYKDFCKCIENQSLESCLMTDLQLCQEDDVRLFTFLVPDVYMQFSSIAVGNVDLVYLIVSSIDSSQLQDLICEILCGHLVMFKKELLLSILNASLDWETIEQYFLWQLIAAHDLPLDLIMSILPKLDYCANAEALSNIMIFLKQDCPSADLLCPLLCRESKKNDLFTVSMIKYWAQEYEDRLADLLHSQLMKSNGTPNKKRPRTQTSVISNKLKDKDQPTTEQILSHLDQMRLCCRNAQFLMHESIQTALQYIQTSCTDTLKAKYSDLLALVEDFDESRSTRVLRQVPSRRASQAATTKGGGGGGGGGGSKSGKKSQDSDSSSESSDDEDNIQAPKAKKTKRTVLFGDD